MPQPRLPRQVDHAPADHDPGTRLAVDYVALNAQVAVGFALLVDGNAVAREERQVAGGEVLRVHGADDGENLLLGRRQVGSVLFYIDIPRASQAFC